MYLVVSRWTPSPGKEEEFKSRGKSVRSVLRNQPGVRMLEYFHADNGDVIAIHGYDDKGAYQRVVEDPKGPFNQALDDYKLEEVSKWVGSDMGEAGVE